MDGDIGSNTLRSQQDKRRIDIYFIQEFVIFISRSHAQNEQKQNDIISLPNM